MEKTLPTSVSPRSLVPTGSNTEVCAVVPKPVKYRRSVVVDGDIVRIFEDDRRIHRVDPASTMTSKYQVQLNEAMRYQIAAGDGDAAHLRDCCSMDASGTRNYVIISNRGVPCEKVIQRPPKEAARPPKEAARSVPCPRRPKTPINVIMQLPNPPATPHVSRLPTPELPTLGKKRFCDCVICQHT